MTKEQEYKNQMGHQCFSRKGWHCIYCGEVATQLAHIIPQDKVMLKRYGYKVIHHWSNRDPVCDLTCNAKSSIRNHPIQIEEKVAETEEHIRDEEAVH